MITRDIRPRPRGYHENELEHTAQSLGSWWAGCRQNDESMDLPNMQWLLDTEKINFVTVGLKKHLQLSISAHGDSCAMAVGRAAFGVLNTFREMEHLEREFSVYSYGIADVSAMVGGIIGE